MTTAEKIKRKGLELGFTHVGIAAADDFTDYAEELESRPDYELWTDKDRSKYPNRSYLSAAAYPKRYYPEGKSIVCATWGYSQWLYPEELTAHVARAYLCRSYVPQAHDAAGIRLAEFKRFIWGLGIGIYEGEHEVPDRAACARAGIITYGKNNFAYTEEDGSFNILTALLVDTELDYDTPTVRCDCPPGCQRCMEACPAGAILEAGRLHPQNCAMYWHQISMGKFDQDRWDKFGVRIHGCDECQLECPRNQAVLKRAARRDPFLEVLKEEFDLGKVLLMDEAYYEAVVRPVMYNYIRDLDIFRRNAAIAIGNSGDRRYIPALEKAMQYENEELRRAVRWALDRLSV